MTSGSGADESFEVKTPELCAHGVPVTSRWTPQARPQPCKRTKPKAGSIALSVSCAIGSSTGVKARKMQSVHPVSAVMAHSTSKARRAESPDENDRDRTEGSSITRARHGGNVTPPDEGIKPAKGTFEPHERRRLKRRCGVIRRIQSARPRCPWQRVAERRGEKDRRRMTRDGRRRRLMQSGV